MMDVKLLKGACKGKRCFILGNGPSLKEVDWSKLEGEIVMGTNGIYDNPWGVVPHYYVCVNPLVLEQMGKGIAKLDTVKFYPGQHEALWKKHKQKGAVVAIDTTRRDPSFCYDLEEPLWEGHTVTYVCLQIAFYMGFDEVILLGLDHAYNVKAQPNVEIISDGPDENHFRADYFGKGTRWNTPDLAMSELAYSLAKQAYWEWGRVIYNASDRTACEVFELRTFNRIHRLGVRVSAVVSGYKSEEYFSGCIRDLMAQTLWDQASMEIVVVCQEGSYEHEFMKGHEWYSHAQIILTDDIPTMYQAWNLGIKAAHGKYITNANTDDRHHPMAYEMMASVLDANPHIDLVYHDSYITWKANQTFKEFLSENGGKSLAAGRVEGEPGVFLWVDYSKAGLRRGCFIGPQPMWRATAHQRVGLFNEEFESAGDYEMWLRMAKAGMEMYHIRIPLGLYHANPEGVELGDKDKNSFEARKALAMHQDDEGFWVEVFDEKTLAARCGEGLCLVDKDGFVEMAGEVEDLYAEMALRKEILASQAE